MGDDVGGGGGGESYDVGGGGVGRSYDVGGGGGSTWMEGGRSQQSQSDECL